jgi:outer membrane protein assembly factor BamB
MKQASLFIILIILSSCAHVKKLGIKAPERKSSHLTPKWIKSFDPHYESGNLPISTASPLIHEGMLFIGTLTGLMNAYDLETGRLLWSEKHDQTFNSKPVIFNNALIYGSMQGRVFSRDYLTGKLFYAADVGSSIESDPSLIGARLFFHLRDHRILAMDAVSGKIFWSYKRSVPYLTTLQRVSRPMAYKNNIIVGFADGYVCSLSVEEGVLNWEQRITNAAKFVDVDVQPIYFNSKIVVGSGSGDIKFLDPENGTILQSYNFSIAVHPIKLKNSLLFGTTDGRVVLMDESGQVFKHNKLTKSSVSSMNLWKEGLIVTTMDGLVHYVSLVDLKPLSTFNLGHEQSSVFGYLEVDEGTAAVYSSRNRMYVFR